MNENSNKQASSKMESNSKQAKPTWKKNLEPTGVTIDSSGGGSVTTTTGTW